MDMILSNAQAIADLGFMIIVAAVFVYLFIYQYKQNVRNQKAIMDYMMKTLKPKEEEDNETESTHLQNLDTRMKISNSINTKLYEIRTELNAYRMLMVEFHNSNENLSGLPFAKFSATYEQSRRGVRSVINSVVNYPFSMLSGIITDLDEHGIYHLKDIEELDDKYGLFYNILKSNDILHCYIIGLYDLHGKLFGVLGIQYDEESYMDKFTDEYLASLGTTFGSILDLKNPTW